MILYIMYNADLLEIIGDEEKEDSLGFVDDIALMAVGDDLQETTNRLETLMTKEGGGLEWSRDHNSRFETSKSVILHATRRTQPDPENMARRIPLERPALVVNGQAIQEVSSFKYLGILIDNQLLWNEQAQRASANATKWLLQFQRLTRPTTGVSSKLMRQLYLSVALPKITYGIDVWYSPPNKPTGAIKSTGSVGTLKSLQKLQRMATLAITGALRSTPTDLLDAHAGVLPMELALLKACHRAAVRMTTLPKAHSLHRKVKKAKKSPPLSHLGPIDNLIKLFQLGNVKMETISPMTDDPAIPLRHKITISKTRKESIEAEKRDEADFKIYTDGSNFNGGVGAAAVMYRKGFPRPIKQLKAHLGETEEHNSYEAETVGGILAMHLINTSPDTQRKTVSIYVDCQAFIKASTHPRASSTQHLLQNFASRASNSLAKISVAWISGHSNVPGNEKADKLAKEAAEGRASRRADLPHILSKPLPVNSSASKQEFLAYLKRRWKEDWQQSPRKTRMERTDDSFPFNKYRERQDKLSRAQASILMQVRSGHLPLNVYLQRIGKAESKKCQACKIGPEHDTPAETIQHYLYDCEAYTNLRLSLFRSIGTPRVALKDIMQNTKHMKALANFITRTKRFEVAVQPPRN